MLKKRKKKISLILGLVLILACTGLPLLYYWGRPLPVEMRTEPFQGITYYRRVHFTPYPLVAHIVLVDLQAAGIGFLVTPGDPKEEYTLVARTTSHFARSMDVQIAINGDGFSPWWSNGAFDYFPHTGDRVAPAGFAISNGVGYGSGSGPTIFFSANQGASFNPGDVDQYNAISGNQMVVVDGRAVDGLDNSYPAPRTAIGLDEERKHLILFVADGRQPLYSDGATLQEMANLLVYYGAYNAMNMDGGGSSTLVMRNNLGFVEVVNSPIHTGIPGRERPVGNHLGIFAQR